MRGSTQSSIFSQTKPLGDASEGRKRKKVVVFHLSSLAIGPSKTLSFLQEKTSDLHSYSTAT